MEDITPQLAESEAISSRSATALRKLEERARSTLSAQRGQIAQFEASIAKQLDAIAASIAHARATESDSAKQSTDAHAELQQLREEAENAQAAWQLEKAAQDAELNALRTELETLSARFAEQERLSTDWLAERTSLVGERDELLKKVAGFDARRETDKHQSQSELDEFERRLQEQQASWNEQRAAWDQRQAEMAGQRDELQQKFELALQDVQRFRGRVAELEQELARRPETEQADSAELVALRAERDALAQRVEELEQQPATDANADEQMSDLQRRFEMAVEDLRELKTKNAELEARLVSKKAAPADSGGSDWESMKRRMLASLEEATDGDDPLPEKERIAITDTIEMTDAVVADKDREIERLKGQLAEMTNHSQKAAADQQQQEVNELLDADAVIIEHRKRISLLEREMEDKLRAAELELSVERARMARQKAELEELRVELESRRHSTPVSSPATTGQPRRRWLSKLGISSDEQ